MIPSRSDSGRPSVKDGEHPRGDLGQIIFFGLFLFVWILDSFFIRFSTISSRWLPLGVRLAAGGILFLAAVAMVREGHRVLSEKIRRDGSLVKTGVFARVRHPLYLGTLLFYAALAASTASLASLGVLAVIFGFYDRIAAYEEDVLLKKYGKEYESYRRNVRRWRPRLSPAG